MKKDTYNPQSYWENRLQNNFSIAATGNSGRGKWYNYWLYKAKLRALNKIITKYHMRLKNKTIIDLGTGTGFFIDYYLRFSPKTLMGVDITKTSIIKLQKNTHN